MKKKSNLFIFPLILIEMLSFLSNSCEKDNNNPGNLTNGKTTAVFNPDTTYGTLTDIDGNVYKTITIETQTWMAENLRTTKYNDGTNIHFVPDQAEWSSLYNYDAYCNYNNTTNIDTIATYGRLYNGWAVKTGKLAPSGWHVPTDDEWTTLINSLGGDTTAGLKLQESGSLHWISSYALGTNESGFTALPGGSRWGFSGRYLAIGYETFWWSSSENEWGNNLLMRRLYYPVSFAICEKYTGSMADGYSVRCIKD